jgi:hypothetical protein
MHHATPITAGMFAMGTMIVTFWFTFAVILMARFSKNPRRTHLSCAAHPVGPARLAGDDAGSRHTGR